MTSSSDAEFVVRTIAQTAVDNEKYFGDLDSVVGDGDFGYSLARGFEIVLKDWDGYDRSDIGTFLQKIGVAISSRIGGTSGPIWGTGFLRAAGVAKGKEELSGADAVAMLRASIAGIMARGNAELGDKTLLDALAPMTDAIEAALAAGEDSDAVVVVGRLHRPSSRGCHDADDRQARASRLHRRAQHRLARCRRRRDRGDRRGDRGRMADEGRERLSSERPET